MEKEVRSRKDHGKGSVLKKLKQSNLKLKAKKQVVCALGSIPTYDIYKRKMRICDG